MSPLRTIELLCKTLMQIGDSKTDYSVKAIEHGVGFIRTNVINILDSCPAHTDPTSTILDEFFSL